MDPNHCLRGLYIKEGGGPQLKIIKSSETSKSAFFSFGESKKLKTIKSSEASTFAFISFGGPTYIFLGDQRTYHTYYNVSSHVLSNGDVNTSNA